MVDASQGFEMANVAVHTGRLLREARLERGMTQSQVAEQSNISQGLVSNMEAGRSRIDLGLVAKCAAVLGLSLPELTKEAERRSVRDDDEDAAMAGEIGTADGGRVVRSADPVAVAGRLSEINGAIEILQDQPIDSEKLIKPLVEEYALLSGVAEDSIWQAMNEANESTERLGKKLDDGRERLFDHGQGREQLFDHGQGRKRLFGAANVAAERGVQTPDPDKNQYSELDEGQGLDPNESQGDDSLVQLKRTFGQMVRELEEDSYSARLVRSHIFRSANQLTPRVRKRAEKLAEHLGVFAGRLEVPVNVARQLAQTLSHFDRLLSYPDAKPDETPEIAESINLISRGLRVVVNLWLKERNQHSQLLSELQTLADDPQALASLKQRDVDEFGQRLAAVFKCPDGADNSSICDQAVDWALGYDDDEKDDPDMVTTALELLNNALHRAIIDGNGDAITTARVFVDQGKDQGDGEERGLVAAVPGKASKL